MSAHLQRFVILMLVINHVCLQPMWLITMNQNFKPLLMSRQITVSHVLSLMYIMIHCSYIVIHQRRNQRQFVNAVNGKPQNDQSH